MMKSPHNKGHLLVTSDISPAMQSALIERFKEAGFLANSINSFYASSEEITERLTFFDEEKGIHIKSYLANNESLPFASSQFNSYTASLSLNLVDNHMNQLREAHRVLLKGGIAGFSVWGRKEHTAFFTLIVEALTAVGV